MLAEFKSPMHGSAELYEDKIIIKKSTSAGISFIGKSEKTIYLRQLAGVTVKKVDYHPVIYILQLVA